MLPLRLAAEPILRRTIGQCFILPSVQEEKLCYVIADVGLVALVTEGTFNMEDIITISSVDANHLPLYTFARVGVEFCWFRDGVKLMNAPTPHDVMSCVPSISKTMARCITESVTRYYARQVLEPSIRGFLAILEKQFPRNDLYLFELLQNAVDDGATKIVLRDFSNTCSDNEGVLFCHDGRGFSPLDVLGLASVGLSTKGVEGKRKIGFMGVGFKAVYKRYARVLIYDDLWSFSFEEPSVTPEMEPSHSWVMKPQWVPAEAIAAQIGGARQLSGTDDTSRWCHFLLQRPRGGMRSVTEDLSRLPSTAPVLLGRQALGAISEDNIRVSGTGAPNSWQLIWKSRKYEVSRESSQVAVPHILPALSSSKAKEGPRCDTGLWIRSYADSVRIKVSGVEKSHSSCHSLLKDKEQLWQFLTVCFHPSEEAQRAFEVHTKKKWAAGPQTCGDVQAEDISLFFEVSSTDGLPVGVSSNAKGTVHAMLPTKLRVPSPVHVQGPWLLSVDRQDVQSIEDNSWNNCLLSQIPRLYASLLRWLCAKTYSDAESLQRAFKMLPVFTLADNSTGPPVSNARRLGLRVLDQWVSMTDLSDLICAERVTPVLLAKECDATRPSQHRCPEISFARAHEIIWLPPVMMQYLTVAEVEKWFGCHPFASMQLGEYSWHDMWRCNVPLPTTKLLQQRKKYFKMPSSDHADSGLKVSRAVAALAALGGALSTVPPEKKAAVESSSASVSTKLAAREEGVVCGGWLPSLGHWPLFLTESGEFATAADMVWAKSDEFSDPSIPAAVLTSLRRGVAMSVLQTEKTGNSINAATTSGGNKFIKKKWTSNSQRRAQPEVPPVTAHLLDFDVELHLLDCSRKGSLVGPERLAMACLGEVQQMCPSRVVGVEAASRALMQHWATMYARGPIPVDVILTIVELFRWYMTSNRPGAVSHLLVGEVNPSEADLSIAYKDLRLLQSKGSYIRPVSELREKASQRIVSLAPTESLPYISTIYHKDRCSSTTDSFSRWFKSYHDFLVKCGAQSGVALVAFVRKLEALEIESLPDKRLPKLRQSATSVDMALPFNLGILSRKRVEVIDVDIAAEWTDILLSLSIDTTAAAAVAVLICQLLGNADYADVITPDSTPYASPLLRGKVDEEITRGAGTNLSKDIANHRVPSDVDRFPPPGFARAFFLPPGQPGASAGNVAVAAWIKRLAREKWVPAAMPGAPAGSPATTTLRPCEVLLSCALEGPTGKDSSGNRIVIRNSSSEAGDEVMPTARLSVRALRILQGLPKQVSDVFAWGTVKPPPPVDQLESFAKLAPNFDENLEYAFQGGAVTCSEVQYTELVGIWRGLCIAHREKRLSISDRHRIQQTCGISRSSSYGRSRTPSEVATPHSVFILPGHLPNSLYTLSRCVALSGQAGDVEGDGKALNNKEIVSSLLCRVGYLFELSSDSSHSDAETVTSRRDTAKSVSWPLGPFRRELVDLLSFSSEVKTYQACDFLKQAACFDSDDVVGRASPPTPAMKKAISYSLWALVTHFAGDLSATANVDNYFIDRAQKGLRTALSNLHVYCSRGPGVGPAAFDGRWLPVWPVDAEVSSLVRPVLLDDLYAAPRGCGVRRSTLLRKEHRLQPLGIFDHCNNRHLASSLGTTSRDFLMKLSTIDTIILKILDIPTILDRKYFSLLSKTTGKAEDIEGGTQRLQVVLYLLQVLMHDTSVNPPPAPPIFKHESLSIIFKIPEYQDGKTIGMSAVHTYPVFAIRGAPVPMSSVRPESGVNSQPPATVQSILVAGSSDDYSSELEDIICGIALSGRHTPQNVSPLVRKALSLLRYLESEEDFFKYFDRYFREFEDPCSPGNHTQPRDEDASEPATTSQRLLSKAMKALKELKAEKLSSKKRKKYPVDSANGDNIYGPSTTEEVLLQAVTEPLGKLPVKARGGQAVDEELQRNNDEAAMSFLASMSVPSASRDAISPLAQMQLSGGRGRGVLNLPAWMTVADALPGVEGCVGEYSVPKEFADEMPSRGPAGRGRGVSNLPAWMVEDAATNPITSSASSAEVPRIGHGSATIKTNQFDDVGPPEDGVEMADTEHYAKKARTETLAVDSVCVEPPSPPLQADQGTLVGGLSGRSRGRGVSNAPAWMTATNTMPGRDKNSGDGAPDNGILTDIFSIISSVAGIEGVDDENCRHIQTICDVLGGLFLDLPAAISHRVIESATGPLRSALLAVLTYLERENRLPANSYLSLRSTLAHN